MARGTGSLSGFSARRKRNVLVRSLVVQSLETRTVLSGLSLLEAGDAGHHASGDYHEDAMGNAYHVLPAPTQSGQLTQELETTSSAASTASSATVPADVFQLHSSPGAAHTIYLDFDGHTTRGTAWNSFVSGGDIVTPAFSFTGDASFTDSEQARIHAIWERVSEDFIPFDVNVTTAEPALADLTYSGNGDDKWGVRVVIGGDGSWYGSAGGVAYLGSFNWNSDTPVFVFEDRMADGNEKYTAEAISHEAGHALGLYHDGRISPSEEYYQGHGSGATGWAPIMGVGYYKSLTQWSGGDYLSASNTQDDLAIITGNNGFGYRADDHGDSSVSASAFEMTGESIEASGIIETNDDVDVFTFLTGAGTVTLDLAPFYRGPNLDIAASLFDAAGALVAFSNPTGVLSASISAALSAGQYYLQVDGTGEGDPLAGGYSDYGSLGSYSIVGTIVPASGGLLSITPVSADQSEGNSGSQSFTFRVDRSGDSSGEATVNWSVRAAGDNPADATDFAGGILPAGTVVFAPGETTKSVSISVAGDLEVEGDEGFEVVLSDASSGNLIATSTAAGTIRNDDVPPAAPGITVEPSGGLTTSETGGTASFTVVLDSQPTADVVIPISSSNPDEGTTNVDSLTFTPANWSTAQTVRVSGVDDTVRDGNISYTIVISPAISGDAGYDGLDAADLDATNQDDEKGKKTSGGGGDTGGGGNGGGRGKNKTSAISAIAITQSFDLALPPTRQVVTDSDSQGDDQTEAIDAAIVSNNSNVKRETWNTGSAASAHQDALSAILDDLTGSPEGNSEATDQIEAIEFLWSELGRQ